MRIMPPGLRSKVYGEAYVSRAVSVVGLVRKPCVFSAEELRQRPATVLEGVPILCGSGKVKDKPRRLSGVLLRDLLDEAEIIIDEHEDPNRTYVAAVGNDGYCSLFSWHELFNTPVGEGVLVALEKDGRPLPVEEGELCLVSAADERPGPRRVRYLTAVEVRRIEPYTMRVKAPDPSSQL